MPRVAESYRQRGFYAMHAVVSISFQGMYCQEMNKFGNNPVKYAIT